MSPENNISNECEPERRQHCRVLHPVDVVNFARDPRTTLHALFDWNDDNAIDQYRLAMKENQ